MKLQFRPFTAAVVCALMAVVISLSVSGVSAQDVTTFREGAPDAASAQLQEFANGFTRPLLATNAGDGSGRLFVVEQGGKIWIIRDGVTLDTPFLDVSSLVSREAVAPTGYTERGLLGLAFSPTYADDGRFYIDYTDVNGTSVLARYQVSADNPDAADPASAEVLLTQEQPYANHNGGHLAFGADGYLYVAFGDGGDAGDPQNRAQNLGTWLGKILRIDVSGDAYTVPNDNPFVSTAGALPEIWAYGLRNPWRFTFDRATGDLYIGDVGQNTWEEVDFQPAGDPGGENYGWRPYEATHPYSGEAAPANMTLPIAEYNHNDGISIAGGYVYRGAALPDLQGTYLYGDWGTGTIWAAWRDSSMRWHNGVFMAYTGHNISSFGEDEAGELYIIDYSGSIFKLTAAQ